MTSTRLVTCDVVRSGWRGYAGGEARVEPSLLSPHITRATRNPQGVSQGQGAGAAALDWQS
ncbi:hypothetical protein GOSPT_046_00340 [Gordonia sputi NBRC 100414]|uniref:Uncharacterized protein n=1 Tax=Gordonia sputi NBRC 100414 TaxID=1089453 RepID=H5TYL0_9ACTN|nr:hypothetical protein GOSPT_046_00340 [Gordonia sputi NBRC 100414]